MFSTLKRQLAVTFMFVFGACAGVLLLAVMALVVLTVLIVRGILLINSRASNIICLAAALAVTTCSAWALADYLSGTLLWIVALATGCVAGSAVVVTRELVTHAFPRLANSTRAFAERTIDSRIRPLTAWWLVPEKAFVTAASASPEQV